MKIDSRSGVVGGFVAFFSHGPEIDMRASMPMPMPMVMMLMGRLLLHQAGVSSPTLNLSQSLFLGSCVTAHGLA
jgi:hypothetical protein